MNQARRATWKTTKLRGSRKDSERMHGLEQSGFCVALGRRADLGDGSAAGGAINLARQCSVPFHSFPSAGNTVWLAFFLCLPHFSFPILFLLRIFLLRSHPPSGTPPHVSVYRQTGHLVHALGALSNYLMYLDEMHPPHAGLNATVLPPCLWWPERMGTVSECDEIPSTLGWPARPSARQPASQTGCGVHNRECYLCNASNHSVLPQSDSDSDAADAVAVFLGLSKRVWAKANKRGKRALRRVSKNVANLGRGTVCMGNCDRTTRYALINAMAKDSTYHQRGWAAKIEVPT